MDTEILRCTYIVDLDTYDYSVVNCEELQAGIESGLIFTE